MADTSERSDSPSRPRLIDKTTVFFTLIALASGAGVWWVHGPSTFQATLNEGLILLALILPVIAAAMLIGSYVQRLIPQAIIERWLGSRSGLRGYLVATLAGVVTPGGPFAAFPLVVALYRAGAAFEICIVYLTAWALLGIHRILIWEIPLLGFDFVAVRVIVSLPLPLVAGLLARRIVRGPRP
ncbi:hypothetical protein CAI21_14765 [Alkalilimnicola ehrlichii]|uniref:Permease n=1 Tax=Alkalilimnicola ehrlichii TaxID=351052 RepID=A0A3E0WN59_9GAMM|nr:permease [Alkalilimnicola ehrlichii]RFA27301.1 hypothetical protein CAI21_14765 [Alkalilimnicola ehrlichii]RFA34410.1 hypothetical protein CAL65_15335 [Alkalilimnicola ehrlichii]